MLDRINRFFEWFSAALFVALMIGFVVYATKVAIERNSHPLLVFLLAGATALFVTYRLVRSATERAASRKRWQELMHHLDQARAWSSRPTPEFLSLEVAGSFCSKPIYSQDIELIFERRTGLLRLLLLVFALLSAVLAWHFISRPSVVTGLQFFLALAAFAICKIQLPKRVQANKDGIVVDGAPLVAWAEIESFRLVHLSGTLGSKMMEIVWARQAFRRRSWRALQAGGVRLPSAYYRSSYRTMSDAHEIMKRWWSGVYTNDLLQVRLVAIEQKYESQIRQWREKETATGKVSDGKMEATLAKLRLLEEQNLLMEMVRREIDAELAARMRKIG